MKLNGIEVNDTADLSPQQEDTSWFGPPAFINYSEENGALVVHVTKRRRKGDVAVAIAFLLAGIVCFVFPAARGTGCILSFISVVVFFQVYLITTTKMIVNEWELSSRFTGRFLRRNAQVFWNKAGRLIYMTQTKYRPEGLYAKRGWLSHTCLIPGVDSTQTKEIIAKIYARFPQQQPIA